MKKFEIISKMKPTGDQPQAIDRLVEGLMRGDKEQTLLGITGSGKTFTVANVIERVNKPTLVIAHNKTLAAQLYNEFKEIFPNNAVEYFISYYDYYQPEAYIPRTDTYIEKSAMINEEIDRLRHNTTRSLYERNDVIVVASVSCIYGLGLPESYFKGTFTLEVNQEVNRKELLSRLVKSQFSRNDLELKAGTFRSRGENVEIMMSFEKVVTRVSFFDDFIEKITRIDPVSAEVIEKPEKIIIYPAVHYISYDENQEETIKLIRQELTSRVVELKNQGKLLEAQRLHDRVNFDIEMIKEMGYCSGIENYSQIIERRPKGSPPATLLDYFPDDFLLIIDESHVTLPQLRGMYNADKSRKEILVDYGFRLPCAKDNRPLTFEEFWNKVNQKIFVSATPSDFELEVSTNLIEQIIRPTGLLDPDIEIHQTKNQVDDLLREIDLTVKRKNRVLITTLTKKMAEDLTDYLKQFNIKVQYIHSGLESMERVEVLRDLRMGEIDVLVGVNLLREGLDMPEVELVCIMDADKEGFLRSEKSLIQTIGRAARNSLGRVIMYADNETLSMKNAIEKTLRRRKIQIEYNKKHNITPKTIYKPVENNLLKLVNSYRNIDEIVMDQLNEFNLKMEDLPKVISKLEKEMQKSAKNLDFEKAAQLRDKLKKLREMNRI